MDKTTSDTLFHINQMFNFVEPINNPTELTIGDTLYNIHVYAGYKITHPRFPHRKQDQDAAVDFFMALYHTNIPYIAIENPVGVISSRFRKPDQIVQPFMFGNAARKTTCLWLKGLPLLEPTELVSEGESIVFRSGKKMPKWYCDALTNAKTDAERRRLRSKTFDGIAQAMASQWGTFVKHELEKNND